MAPLFGLFVAILALMVATLIGVTLAAIVAFGIITVFGLIFFFLFAFVTARKFGRRIFLTLLGWQVFWLSLTGGILFMLFEK